MVVREILAQPFSTLIQRAGMGDSSRLLHGATPQSRCLNQKMRRRSQQHERRQHQSKD